MGDGYYDDVGDAETWGLGYARSTPRGGYTDPIRWVDLETLSPGVTGFVSVHTRARDEGEKMKTSDELLTEAESLRLQAERLEEIAAQRAKYGADPFKNGTVLKIDMKYRTGRTTYSYGAVKTAGRYWLSGRLIPQDGATATPIASGWTWDQLVGWLAQGDATVWRARSLEQVL